MNTVYAHRLHTQLEQQAGGEMIAWRRYLHAHPELSFQEEHTAAWIAERLTGWGWDIRTGVGGHGIVATLHGEHPGKTVAFRADFDALPIQDAKETAYRSTVDGVMHACGHDGHTAALLGAALVLSEERSQLHGSLVLLFQPAEEQPPGGAAAMIEGGCLEDVDAVYGIHLSTQLPVGEIGLCDGPFMASVDAFTITIQGKGGHGARPHETVDSIVLGCQIVGQLQQIVSRRISPMQAAVVSVGKVAGGSAFNVIADTMTIEGTVRAFDPAVRRQVEEELRLIVAGACSAARATAAIDYLHGYPPLVNDAAHNALLEKLLGDTLPETTVTRLEPRMGAEDFAYYLQERPGTFFNVGARGEDERTRFPHHHPRFDFDERALLLSAKAFLSLAAHHLGQERR